MGRPGNAADTIDIAKSHRTKAEIEQRRTAEKSLLSGTKLFERENVKKDSVSHKEFLRVSKLFEKIGKSDALYGAVCNRYCKLFSEAERLVERKSELDSIIDRLSGKIDEIGDTEELTAFTKQFTMLVRQVNAVDVNIMQKRKMMFDIEKENCMTVAASIRAIPKSAEKPQGNPIADILSCDDEEYDEPVQASEQ